MSALLHCASKEAAAARVEFICGFSRNGLLEADAVRDFLCGLESIDGVFLQILDSQIQARVLLPDGNSFPVLTLTAADHAGNPAADIFVCPWDITAGLDKFDFPASGAMAFFSFYKDYVNKSRCACPPYEDYKANYYADVQAVLQNTDAFVEALECFIGAILC